jgi:hypothetical protein
MNHGRDKSGPYIDIVGELVVQAQSGTILALKVSTNLGFANNIIVATYHTNLTRTVSTITHTRYVQVIYVQGEVMTLCDNR